jgi:hypothetical protein
MPNYKTHLFVGTIFSLLFTTIFIYFFKDVVSLSDSKLLFAPLVVWLYSNIPDLDHHMGRLRKFMFLLVFIVLACSMLIISTIGTQKFIFIMTIIGLSGFFLYKMKHRGLMHSYLFAMVIALPLLFLHWFLYLIGFVAMSSHILVDRVWSWVKRKLRKIFGYKGETYFQLKL